MTINGGKHGTLYRGRFAHEQYSYFLNKVHGILNACGIKLKKESLNTEKDLRKAMTYLVDEVSQFEIEVLIQQLLE